MDLQYYFSSAHAKIRVEFPFPFRSISFFFFFALFVCTLRLLPRWWWNMIICTQVVCSLHPLQHHWRTFLVSTIERNFLLCKMILYESFCHLSLSLCRLLNCNHRDSDDDDDDDDVTRCYVLLVCRVVPDYELLWPERCGTKRQHKRKLT